MIIKRTNLQALYSLIESKGQLHFSISTQYKLLKIKKILVPEIEIYNQQIATLNSYFEKDENGNIFYENGFVKVRNDLMEEFQTKYNEINEVEIQLPDLYFSLEEMEPLGLTMNELELLEPFIKT